MKKLISILFLLFIMSCSERENTTEILIRLKNNSSVNFDKSSFNNVEFGKLAPDETSNYQSFEVAYHYGLVSIVIEGQEYGWIPIDYVGETPLKPGKYTFEYSFDTVNKVLTDKFIVD
ncbi:hypothetical protein [Tenacibaculum sp. 190524A05c]|uniref:hypothetical protein n=1 Tax=Tenacibaculum platacis TaxID=3137852 RepID=UPI0031FB3D25